MRQPIRSKVLAIIVCACIAALAFLKGGMARLVNHGWSQTLCWIAVAGAYAFALTKSIGVVLSLCARDARKTLTEDKRAPILFLRSFRTDGSRQTSGEFSDEALLRSLFKATGPLIAIGKPGEILQTVGADRLYVEEGASWQEAVKTFIQEAHLIVLQPGATPGIHWELSAVRMYSTPSKVLIFFPLGEKQAREVEWNAFKETCKSSGMELTNDLNEETTFVAFKNDWISYALRGDRPQNYFLTFKNTGLVSLRPFYYLPLQEIGRSHRISPPTCFGFRMDRIIPIGTLIQLIATPPLLLLFAAILFWVAYAAKFRQ